MSETGSTPAVSLRSVNGRNRRNVVISRVHRWMASFAPGADLHLKRIAALMLPLKMVYRGGCGTPWMMSARPLSLVIADRGRATSIIEEGAIKWSISLVWTCR
jgi:hypothetical protein